jgi:trehalose 6-phosphate phosphatase
MLSPAIGDLSPPPGLSQLQPVSLFIDFDGTLVDLIDRPDEVCVDPALHHLLTSLAAALHGRLALVSGRSVAQLDSLLGPLGATLAVAGSHGVERRGPGGDLTAPARAPALAAAEQALSQFAAAHSGVLVEPKTLGVALHYRMGPEHQAAAQQLCREVAEIHGLSVQHGKMMVELRGVGDKGDAVRAFMSQPPMAGSRPLFVGDDLTDEPGFAAARALDGAGVLVGLPRPTAAVYRLDNVEAVRAWLAGAMA